MAIPFGIIGKAVAGAVASKGAFYIARKGGIKVATAAARTYVAKTPPRAVASAIGKEIAKLAPGAVVGTALGIAIEYKKTKAPNYLALRKKFLRSKMISFISEHIIENTVPHVDDLFKMFRNIYNDAERRDFIQVYDFMTRGVEKLDKRRRDTSAIAPESVANITKDLEFLELFRGEAILKGLGLLDPPRGGPGSTNLSGEDEQQVKKDRDQRKEAGFPT